jgi:hypothetical protein
MPSSNSAADSERPWHNVSVEVSSVDGTPMVFQSIRIETRRQDAQGHHVVQWLGRMDYDPEKKGVYSFRYKLKNPNASVWLAVVAEGGESAQLISVGKHRYWFPIESPSGPSPTGRRGENRGGKRSSHTTMVTYNYYISRAENVYGNVEDLGMAKYNVKGSRNIVTAEKARITGSFNKGSQVQLAPEVEDAFKKASETAKKTNSSEAQKAIQALKREAKKKVPDKSKMQSLWSGVTKAMPAITKTIGTTAVSAITQLFS